MMPWLTAVGVKTCRKSGSDQDDQSRGTLSAGLNRAALLTQPHRAGIHAALLLLTRRIEGTDHVGRELSVTQELRLTVALRFRAAEGELPVLAVTVSDALRAA